MVMADLSRLLHTAASLDWMAISSLWLRGQFQRNSPHPQDLDTDIAGQHVLIVEDVLDSGLTLDWLVRTLGKRGAASLRVMTLLRKPEAVANEVEVHCGLRHTRLVRGRLRAGLQPALPQPDLRGDAVPGRCLNLTGYSGFAPWRSTSPRLSGVAPAVIRWGQ